MGSRLATLLVLMLLAPRASAAEVKTVVTPFIRAGDSLNHMRLDAKGRFAAFIDGSGLGLGVVDLKTKTIHKVSQGQIGASFFWSPDGFRLFYRELAKAPDGAISSTLKAFDAYLGRSVTLEKMAYPTGFLTFDPRDLRMHLMSPMGIRTKRIYFPDERMARWQVAQRNESGKWLATQKSMLWVTQGGYQLRKLEDDKSGIDSFDISPDGNAAAWATKSGKIYVSKKGKEPSLLAHGKDPRWHPKKMRLVFAGARMVGNRAASYDLKIADLDGTARFLTKTQMSDERWPQWHPDGEQILYTLARTTDLFVLDFQGN